MVHRDTWWACPRPAFAEVAISSSDLSRRKRQICVPFYDRDSVIRGRVPLQHDFRANALVREDLKQDGMRHPAIDK